MQLVVPRAVAMAVRMLIMTWMRNFQVSRLESFIKLPSSSPVLPPVGWTVGGRGELVTAEGKQG